jgi:hypothetical protein
MPAKPSYADRIPGLIRDLAASQEQWIDRRQLEERLGISKTVAWRLLRRMGATGGPGNTLTLTRDQAIAGLRELQAEGTPLGREIRRRDRLQHYLDRMQTYLAARHTTVVSHVPAASLRNSRFEDLPPNVELTPRSLHIDFQSPAEFLAAFGAVVFALQNDYDAIRDFIEAPQNGSTVATHTSAAPAASTLPEGDSEARQLIQSRERSADRPSGNSLE